jgi:hypothetical protein
MLSENIEDCILYEDFKFWDSIDELDDASLSSDYICCSFTSEEEESKTSMDSQSSDSNKRRKIDNHLEKYNFIGQGQADERQKYLLSAPRLIQKCFNTGNFDKMKEILDDIFLEDCSLQTPSMLREEYGKNRIVDMFVSLANSFPDMVLNSKKSSLNVRKKFISLNVEGSGTKRFTDKDEHLFNIFLQQSDSAEKPDDDLMQRVQSIEASGGHYRLYGKSIWYFILTSDMLSVKKLVVVYKTKEFVVTPFNDCGPQDTEGCRPSVSHQVQLPTVPRPQTLPSAVIYPISGYRAQQPHYFKSQLRENSPIGSNTTQSDCDWKTNLYTSHPKTN